MRHLWLRGLFTVLVLAAVGVTGPVGLVSWAGAVLGAYVVLVLAVLTVRRPTT